MARGEFRLATQSGLKGYFGKVSLDVEPSEIDGDVTIDFDDQRARLWQSGARFGIDYALEHISKRKFFPKGVRVHVNSIEGHEVDTTNVVIAYVSANALFSALNVDPKHRPNLDPDQGLVVFPK